MPFHFFSVDRFDSNVFTFYGCFGGVHSRLILLSNNESELAAVMAHKIAHVQQRHLARISLKHRPNATNYTTRVTRAAVVSMAAPGSTTHLISFVLGSHIEQLIQFTSDHEEEANNVGVQILAKSDFNTYSLSSIFDRMNHDTRFNSKPTEYLRTHPIFTDRFATSQNHASRFQYRKTTYSLNYQLIKALLYLDNLPLETILESYNNKAVHYYGYALALTKNRNYKQSDILFKNALNAYPDHNIITLGLIENENDQLHFALKYVNNDPKKT